MAGESPDKSEQRKSSGETTGGERDPRLGIFRESEKTSGKAAAKRPSAAAETRDSASGEDATPEADLKTGPKTGPKAGATAGASSKATGEQAAEKADRADAHAKPTGQSGKSAAPAEGADKAADAPVPPGGNARLKAAVAAWVAGAEDGEDTAEGAGARSGAEKAAGPEKAEEAGKAEKPEKAEKAEKADDGEAAAKPPVDRATAVLKAVSPKAEKEDASAGETSPKAPADQPTAVFGALRPKAEGADKSDKGDDAPKAPADQPTAVFGALRPKAETAETGAKNGKDAKGANGVKNGKAAGAAKGDDAPKAPADQPTAVFGAVRPKSDAPAASVDQPTELLKAPEVKAPEAKSSETKSSEAEASRAKKSAAESDSERTSQFVPLKSLDDAAKTGPAKKAPAKAAPAKTAPAKATPAKSTPAKAEAPAAAGSAGQAAKPAIPVSVAPPSAVPKPPEQPAKPGEGSVPPQPAAPLDLLAQLTNTPPPPETPVRNAVRRVKIWTPLVVLLAIIFCVVQAFRPLPDTKLALASGKGTYAFGGDAFSMPWPDHGQAAAMVAGVGSLGTFGEEKPVPTASVAKVMTAYVILKDHPLKKGEQGPDIEVDDKAEQEAASADESRVDLKKGQKFSEYNLLQMLLIPSGNNAARLLARWDAGGDEEAFVAKMNAAAKDLGMSKTTYTDPSGFKDTTKSTAVDQLKLAEAVMKNEVIRDIVAKPNSDVPGHGRLNNNNDTLLLKPGVLGIKTGSSTPAGGALMWAAKRTIGGKEQQILGVTMDQHFKGLDPNAENSLLMVKTVSYKMIKAVQDAMTAATIVKKGEVVGYVEDGLGGRTPVVATRDLTGAGWPGMKAKLTIGKGGKPVPHTAKAGTEVGELTVGSGTGAMKVPVALKKELTEPSFGSKLTRLG
ncbi:serine hydrolase [Streptomyces sp. NPDC046215]|uniref:serine hydrolase n=1 Tax=Streptomyces TaxID=1883 RepID=UPI0031D9DD9D